MLPGVIDFLLTLRKSAGTPVAFTRSFQIAIPNFPPLRTINYQLAPTPLIYAYIIYETIFGQAMVPHSFDVKMNQGGNKILDAVISGRFTNSPVDTLVVVKDKDPITMAVTNIRMLVNYFESTAFYLAVPQEQDYNIIVDALRRMYTSAKLEQQGEKTEELLNLLLKG